MTSPAEINKLLDQLSNSQRDFTELKNKYNTDPEFQLKNSKTGKIVDKEFVFNTASGVIQEIKDNLNKMTDDGSTCPHFPFNDIAQDKIIAEEIRVNKLQEEINKQKPESN